MAEDYLEYGGQLVDDEPIAVVLYATTWRKYLLGLALALREREFWKPNALVDDAVAQADAFITLLLGEPGVTLLSFPTHHTFLGGEALINVGAKYPVWSANAAQIICGSWNQNVSANSDYFDFSGNFANGSYTVTIFGIKHSVAGKSELYVDGVLIADSLKDWYNGTTVLNEQQVLEIELAANGFHLLRLRVNGKNPASTGYFLLISAIVIRYR